MSALQRCDYYKPTPVELMNFYSNSFLCFECFISWAVEDE